MRNSQDTFKTHKRSFINLHDCTFECLVGTNQGMTLIFLSDCFETSQIKC